MAYSKVILNNATLMDVTDTTAVAGDVAQSKYFYLASGVKTEGTASGVDYLVQPQTFTATNSGNNYYYTSLADTPWDTEQVETITVVFDGTTYENIPFTGMRYGAPTTVGPDGAFIDFSDYPFAIGSFLGEDVEIVVADNNQHTVSAVAGSGGEGGSTGEKTVKFIDYDGTILYEYTADEASALTELPANPSHTDMGLIADGWNYTLAEVKTEAETMGQAIVGQCYVTQSGKTEIDIKVREIKTITLKYFQNTSDPVQIDWGDGSSVESSALTNLPTISHTYTNSGNYTILLWTNSATWNLNLYDNSSSAGYPNITSDNRFIQAVRSDSLMNISGYSFIGCIDMKYITVASSSASSGNYPFGSCFSLKGFVVPRRSTSLQHTFENCYNLKMVSIPPSVTEMNASFYNCYNLSCICFPSTVTKLTQPVFNCKCLTTIKFPLSLTTVSSGLVGSCSAVESIEFLSELTSLPNNSFAGCYVLKNPVIPSSVTSWGTGLFSNCTCLDEFTLPDWMTSIPTSTFSSCTSLTKVVIPNTVTSIGNSAFFSCVSLYDISIPSGVTSIGSNAFYGCTSLKAITLPVGITSITNSMLQSCINLTTLTIPSGVTSIGTYAFNSCLGMKEYHFLPTTPPTLANTNAFSGIKSGTIIYVPSASLEDYQTATNWSTYASYMQGE